MEKDWSHNVLRLEFTFDGKKIASLRKKNANENKSSLDTPSRFEVVWLSSIILGALLAGYKGLSDHEDEFTITTPPTNVIAFVDLDLWKRINSPLPEQSLGTSAQRQS